MRAIAYNGKELEFRHDSPCPKRKAGEALVRVRLAGICSTDLEIVKGYFGFCGVLGHEFVGVVDASSDPKWIGKRVVSSINFVPNIIQADKSWEFLIETVRWRIGSRSPSDIFLKSPIA
jgi:threonine dehydrogenase-like Zn-dependent dehydrogenase